MKQAVAMPVKPQHFDLVACFIEKDKGITGKRRSIQ
jgi:hypothetical protein